MYDHVFSPLRVGGLELKNRLTMAPLYLGYAGEAGLVNEPLLEHYRLMATSGVALVVVENASIDHPVASGAKRELLVDTDDCIEGLTRLAQTIKKEDALASLQLNHAGRFARMAPQPVAPSAIETFGRQTRALATEEMTGIAEKFAQASRRVKEAGFDLVELHGATGYLLSEFISPRTNRREDSYGGSIENRCRFPLQVIHAVKSAVGDLPVGYRFLAEEWLPDGLRLEEACRAAEILAGAGIAYLSVMGGTYESFGLPDVLKRSEQPGYMVELAAAVKSAVDIPVIVAGRVDSGALADQIIAEGKADLIGLARVLWADPEWPAKVREGREDEIIPCDCQGACNTLVARDMPALCARWPREKLEAWRARMV